MNENNSQDRTTVNPGTALKALRTDRGWTLSKVSELTGIPVSTLSKIEHSKTELTMDRLLSISVALGVNIADLFGSPTAGYSAGDRGRRSITRVGEGKLIPSPYGSYCYHAQDLLEKRISPIIAEINAKSLEDFGDFHRHEGDEFLLVLSGNLVLYTDTYAPLHLKADESIYFDSAMGHAYVSEGDESCRILLICAPLGAGLIRVMESGAEKAQESVVRTFRKA
jgi:transcriptional regulator with XRE-family HTH domain